MRPLKKLSPLRRRIQITKELCTLIVFLSSQIILNLEVGGFLSKFIPHVFFMTSTLGLDTIFVVWVQYQSNLGVDKLGVGVLGFAIAHTIPPILMAIYGSSEMLMYIHIVWCSLVHAIHYYHVHRFCQVRGLKTPKQYTLVFLEIMELGVNLTMWNQRWFSVFLSVAIVAALAHNSQQYMTKRALKGTATIELNTLGSSKKNSIHSTSGNTIASDRLPVVNFVDGDKSDH